MWNFVNIINGFPFKSVRMNVSNTLKTGKKRFQDKVMENINRYSELEPTLKDENERAAAWNRLIDPEFRAWLMFGDIFPKSCERWLILDDFLRPTWTQAPGDELVTIHYGAAHARWLSAPKLWRSETIRKIQVTSDTDSGSGGLPPHFS
ncbi:unnamed protein product [Amoebophrya sp. A25]|nr:unnamed protein product [Amoebophrya sp. A25]|eukprot:GSA25T00016455001.1